jgi:hypothetical protein
VWDWFCDCLGAVAGLIFFRLVQRMFAARPEATYSGRPKCETASPLAPSAPPAR